MTKIKAFFEKSEQYAVFLISGLMVFIMGFNLTESLFNTTKLEYLPEFLEKISYHHDNVIINIIYVICILFISALVIPYLEKVPSAFQAAFLILFTIIFGTVYVTSAQCIPASDSMMVTDAAKNAANGNYEFMSNQYFGNCSYQLGFVFFCEILLNIFGKNPETFIFLQIINVFLVAATYTGILLIIKKLYPGKRIFTVTVLSLFFCIEPLVFSVFTYGVIPGLAFTVFAFLFEIKMFNDNSKSKSIKILYAFLSVFFITLACMVKLNYLIALTAMLICAFVRMVSKKKLVVIAYIAAAAFCGFNITKPIIAGYEKKSGTELTDSVPFTAYLEMGLNYPEEGYCCCNAAGWFDPSYIEYNHAEHNYNAKETAQASKERIKTRISGFSADYSAANDFFFEKIVSQWNEPTYACLWLNQIRSKYSDPTEPALSIAYDKQNKTEAFMNIYQLIIYLGAFAGIILCFKNKDIFSVLLILTVLGGFFYHLLFEAKSQYILPYFVLLCGFSATGTTWLIDKTSDIITKKKKKTENCISSDSRPDTCETKETDKPSEKDDSISAETPADEKTSADAQNAVSDNKSADEHSH